MPFDTRRYWMGSLPDALIASQVGIWETDLGNDRTVADAVTAALFNLDSMQAALGLPLAAYVEAILPADREAFFTSLDRVSEQGGVFVGEYRVSSGARGLQWILARGHFERDEQTGEVVGARHRRQHDRKQAQLAGRGSHVLRPAQERTAARASRNLRASGAARGR